MDKTARSPRACARVIHRGQGESLVPRYKRGSVCFNMSQRARVTVEWPVRRSTPKGAA